MGPVADKDKTTFKTTNKNLLSDDRGQTISKIFTKNEICHIGKNYVTMKQKR